MAEPLTAPDPGSPDESFRDGDSIYEVSLWPAAFPVRFTQGPNNADFGEFVVGAVYVLTVGLVGRLVDRRWKVVVSRKRVHRMAPWHVIEAEFLETYKLAEEHQLRLLGDWTSGDRADRLPKSAEDLKRMRRDTKAMAQSRRT